MKILLGFTGSVASVLAFKMVHALAVKGHELSIIFTESGLKIVPDEDYKKLNKHFDVYLDHDEWRWQDVCKQGVGEDGHWFDRVEYYREKWQKDDPVLHIELRKWADAMVIAPLSANTMGKIANGLCDNLLTCVARAWDWDKPFVVAPAMNTFMWEAPVTGGQLATMEEWGAIVVPPISKKLACNDEGVGAMARIETIIETLETPPKLDRRSGLG